MMLHRRELCSKCKVQSVELTKLEHHVLELIRADRDGTLIEIQILDDIVEVRSCHADE
jgi:hypothetical protein